VALVWKNGRWVNDNTPTAPVASFSVKLSAPVSGQTLVFDGQNWVNGTPVAAVVDGGNFDPLDGGHF
jgi:hypothetical protein